VVISLVSVDKGQSAKAGGLDHIWPEFSQKYKMHHNSDLQSAIGGQLILAGSGQGCRLFQFDDINHNH